MSDLISYHLIGRFDDGRVFIQSLKVGVVPETLTDQDTMVLIYMCRKAGAIPVCTIRCRRDPDGRPEYFHGYFKNPETPSPEDVNAKNNALLRIAVSGTGHIDEADGAERAIEGVQILEQLGM